MDYLSADKVLIVDLGASEVTEDDLSEDLVAEKIGGAAIAKQLCEDHADGNPIVISTGLLTGTLFPATAAGFITAVSPVTGKISHCPVTLKVGLEIQYSGFDYIVLKGASEKPVFLWVHDGIADVTDAADVWGKDVWDTTESWRKTMGDDLIQTLVIGKAGEDGSDIAQVCCNFWASGDRFGFGKLFGAKKLKGLAFRGMGLLEAADAPEFVELSLDVLEEIKESGLAGTHGIGDLMAAAGHPEAKDWLAPIVHRHSACYNTPYATNTFVFLDADPKQIEETDNPEPGFLVTDMGALLGFHKIGLSAAEACQCLKACARYGIDGAAAAELSLAAGKSTASEIQESLLGLSGKATVAGAGTFSPWCPVQPLFDAAEEAGGDPSAWWERRMAVSYIFGIHPIFAAMCPEITEEDLLEVAGIGTEIEFAPETLDKAIAGLTG